MRRGWRLGKRRDACGRVQQGIGLQPISESPTSRLNGATELKAAMENFSCTAQRGSQPDRCSSDAQKSANRASNQN